MKMETEIVKEDKLKIVNCECGVQTIAPEPETNEVITCANCDREHIIDIDNEKIKS